MMEEEGITITRVKGRSHFYGYYYPDESTPRYWLKDAATKSAGLGTTQRGSPLVHLPQGHQGTHILLSR
jgi:hypothetical protein